jgi:hypothetical protein
MSAQCRTLSGLETAKAVLRPQVDIRPPTIWPGSFAK